MFSLTRSRSRPQNRLALKPWRERRFFSEPTQKQLHPANGGLHRMGLIDAISTVGVVVCFSTAVVDSLLSDACNGRF